MYVILPRLSHSGGRGEKVPAAGRIVQKLHGSEPMGPKPGEVTGAIEYLAFDEHVPFPYRERLATPRSYAALISKHVAVSLQPRGCCTVPRRYGNTLLYGGLSGHSPCWTSCEPLPSFFHR